MKPFMTARSLGRVMAAGILMGEGDRIRTSPAGLADSHTVKGFAQLWVAAVAVTARTGQLPWICRGVSEFKHEPLVTSTAVPNHVACRNRTLRAAPLLGRGPRALRNVVEESLGDTTCRPCRPKAGPSLDPAEGGEQGSVQVLGALARERGY